MTKIPNYDDSYSEHLKKIMKGFIRKGNYVTQLNISLEDLLKGKDFSIFERFMWSNSFLFIQPMREENGGLLGLHGQEIWKIKRNQKREVKHKNIPKSCWNWLKN